LQIKILLCWTIKPFICAPIPQHNDRLGGKPSSIAIFITTISKYSLHDLSNLNLYGKLSNCDSFCVHHSFAYQNFMKRLLGHQELSRLYKFSLFCNWSFINIVCTFFLTIGHFVATPLWGKCEDETRTPKSGKLGSSKIPATSELNCRGQNTLP